MLKKRKKESQSQPLQSNSIDKDIYTYDDNEYINGFDYAVCIAKNKLEDALGNLGIDYAEEIVHEFCILMNDSEDLLRKSTYTARKNQWEYDR